MKAARHTHKFTPQNPRFPGICAAARALGVTRHHLYFVLLGDRQSPVLLARYRALSGGKVQSGRAPKKKVAK
jgi:hypothetical protein